MPKKSSHFTKLHSRWKKRHRQLREDLESKHKEAIDWIADAVPAKEKLASGAVGALMLANTLPTTVAIPNINASDSDHEVQQRVDKQELLKTQLSVMLPKDVRPLTQSEEEIVGKILSDNLGIQAAAQIDNKRLNRSYGYIGAEQHLMRYPGDTMAGHLGSDVVSNKSVYSSGMASGRGAWGYFASSKSDFTDKDKEREKWYIAVQTFLAPDYNSRLGDYRGFFKYRKMLLVNPKTGQAVVSDIGDAGPAQWTGKHLGGSPEVMQALNLHTCPRKGAVLYFFIDDPDDTIPLGPIKGAGE